MSVESEGGGGVVGEESTLLNSPECQNLVKYYRERLNRLLMPYEGWIMKFQCILIWENPSQSAALLIVFNILFWLFTMSSYRVYYLIGSCLLTIFISHSWITKIWPEIKVVPVVVQKCSRRISNPFRAWFTKQSVNQVPVRPEDEDEDWTPVHPALLSVPELSQSLAELTALTIIYHQSFWSLRRNKPGRFCLYCSAVCICGMFIGHYIPGRLLVYIPMMSLILWPSVYYHSLVKRIYMKFEPLFMQLDYSMKIKRSYHRGRTRSASREPPADDSQPRVETDSDTDLDEFVPREFDPVATAALAKAITDSEDESPFCSRSQSPLDAAAEIRAGRVSSPVLNVDPSIPSHLDPDESSLSLLPPSIPGFDELDQSLTSFTPLTTVDQSETTSASPPDVATKRGSPMEFVSDYFHQTSSESGSEHEEKLADDLVVPDVGDTTLGDDDTTPNYLATVAAQTLSQMGAAGAAGLSRLAGYMAPTQRESSVEIQEIDDDQDDVAMETGVAREPDFSPTSLSAEFEFVEHEDIPPHE